MKNQFEISKCLAANATSPPPATPPEEPSEPLPLDSHHTKIMNPSLAYAGKNFVGSKLWLASQAVRAAEPPGRRTIFSKGCKKFLKN